MRKAKSVSALFIICLISMSGIISCGYYSDRKDEMVQADEIKKSEDMIISDDGL